MRNKKSVAICEICGQKSFHLKMGKIYGTVIFLLLLAVHCLLIATQQEAGRIATKLLLVPFLLFLLVKQVPVPGRKSLLIPMLALFFSFLGDLFLTRVGTNFFLLGMVAFILTHILNSIYFLRLQRLDGRRPVPAVFALLIISGAILIVYSIMQDRLGAFRVPMIAYMTIIGLMGTIAANLLASALYRPIAIRCLVPGAAFFILSDALLALDKFYWHAPETWAIPVMATYGIAQLLLVHGFMRVGELRLASV